MKKNRFKLLLLFSFLTLAQSAYSAKVSVMINYFGLDKKVLLEINDDLFQRVQGEVSDIKPSSLGNYEISPELFLSLVKTVRESLEIQSRQGILQAIGEDGKRETSVEEIMDNLPLGYLSSMLRKIEFSKEEAEEFHPVVPNLTNLLTFLKDPNSSSLTGEMIHQLCQQSFGDNYRSFIEGPANQIFTLFSMGTGSNYYYHSQKAEEIRERKAFEEKILVGRTLKKEALKREALKREALNGLSGEAYEKALEREDLKEEEARRAPANQPSSRMKKVPLSKKAWNREKSYSYGMFNGEIVATFAKYADGLSLLNHFRLDGPGSGNYTFQNSFTHWKRSEQHWDKTGNALGFGVRSNIENFDLMVRARLGQLDDYLKTNLVKLNPLLQVQLFLINQISKAHPITALNTIGWSRGAVVTLRLSNVLSRNGVTPEQLPMNIVAIDPVPGIGLSCSDCLYLSPLVRSYSGFYAQHELSAEFVPVLPLRTEFCGEYNILSFPGHHSTVAGSNSKDRDDLENPEFVVERLGAVSQIIRNLSHKKLTQKGSIFRAPNNVIFLENLSKENYVSMYRAMKSLELRKIFSGIGEATYLTTNSQVIEKGSMVVGGLLVLSGTVVAAVNPPAGAAMIAVGGGMVGHTQPGNLSRHYAHDRLDPRNFTRSVNIGDCNVNYRMHQCPEFSFLTESPEAGAKIPFEAYINRHHFELLTQDEAHMLEKTGCTLSLQRLHRDYKARKDLVLNDCQSKCLRKTQKKDAKTIMVMNKTRADDIIVSITGGPRLVVGSSATIKPEKGNNWIRNNAAFDLTLTRNGVSTRYRIVKFSSQATILLQENGSFKLTGCKITAL